MNEGTAGAPITGTSFGPITREDSRKAIKILGGWSEIGADPWVMRIVQWGYKIPFVTLPPLRLQEQETTYPKGSLKWSPLNQSVQELRNQGAIEPVARQGNRGVEADHRSVLPQCLRALPELHYGDASVNPQGPTQAQWLTSLYLKVLIFI